jgi:Fur family transcriptional regulator, zinc uptake regulator
MHGDSDVPTEACGNDIDANAAESPSRSYAGSKGIPFTPMRQRALALLLAASGKPMAAFEIAEKFSDTRKVHRCSTAPH